MNARENAAPTVAVAGLSLPCALNVNGQLHRLDLDPRTTLLDALREHIGLTGTKKGCDHGQCGACTVLLEGRRINSCLTLALTVAGDAVTTIEGLAAQAHDQAVAVGHSASAAPGSDTLHPLQQAFLAHDGFQCGYCTPGQICSAAGMLAEVAQGMPSLATEDLMAPQSALSDAEIRERMSGNLCRCSAYPNIVAAIREVAQAGGA
ncbi:MAG: 2Fe-2S iron-sulfur cluster binding domain-containing protein [Microbacteriaceae bacterium]|nr:2Fe-2S iron-sulfur cluster binding domain-containing protein [Burkholderiaceae bacterium]